MKPETAAWLISHDPFLWQSCLKHKYNADWSWDDLAELYFRGERGEEPYAQAYKQYHIKQMTKELMK